MIHRQQRNLHASAQCYPLSAGKYTKNTQILFLAMMHSLLTVTVCKIRNLKAICERSKFPLPVYQYQYPPYCAAHKKENAHGIRNVPAKYVLPQQRRQQQQRTKRHDTCGKGRYQDHFPFSAAIPVCLFSVFPKRNRIISHNCDLPVYISNMFS